MSTEHYVNYCQTPQLYHRLQDQRPIDDFNTYIDQDTNMYHVNSMNRTMLMLAAQFNHIDVFEYLISNHPELITKHDNIGQNIFHYIGIQCIFLCWFNYFFTQQINIRYIAKSKMDNESMIKMITNKKFSFNKLIWHRNINGYLPKDIAKQHNNLKIMKTIDSIMQDTYSQYHNVAPINKQITSSSSVRFIHQRFDVSIIVIIEYSDVNPKSISTYIHSIKNIIILLSNYQD